LRYFGRKPVSIIYCHIYRVFYTLIITYYSLLSPSTFCSLFLPFIFCTEITVLSLHVTEVHLLKQTFSRKETSAVTANLFSYCSEQLEMSVITDRDAVSTIKSELDCTTFKNPEYRILHNHRCESRVRFNMTGGLQPISSSWRQAP
jgi:hypothetical protein